MSKKPGIRELLQHASAVEGDARLHLRLARSCRDAGMGYEALYLDARAYGLLDKARALRAKLPIVA